jgi:hypothetical protein
MGTDQVTQLETPRLAVYPNPSVDGRYNLSLPGRLTGAISFVLVSPTGATLKEGKLMLFKAQQILQLDFSREMRTSGTYYLKLQGKNMQHTLKLMR